MKCPPLNRCAWRADNASWPDNPRGRPRRPHLPRHTLARWGASPRRTRCPCAKSWQIATSPAPSGSRWQSCSPPCSCPFRASTTKCCSCPARESAAVPKTGSNQSPKLTFQISPLATFSFFSRTKKIIDFLVSNPCIRFSHSSRARETKQRGMRLWISSSLFQKFIGRKPEYNQV